MNMAQERLGPKSLLQTKNLPSQYLGGEYLQISGGDLEPPHLSQLC